MEYVNAKEVKVINVKVAEMNEVKSDEMVPDWLWGGEKHLSVIIIIISIINIIIIFLIFVNIIIIVVVVVIINVTRRRPSKRVNASEGAGLH